MDESESQPIGDVKARILALDQAIIEKERLHTQLCKMFEAEKLLKARYIEKYAELRVQRMKMYRESIAPQTPKALYVQETMFQRRQDHPHSSHSSLQNSIEKDWELLEVKEKEEISMRLEKLQHQETIKSQKTPLETNTTLSEKSHISLNPSPTQPPKPTVPSLQSTTAYPNPNFPQLNNKELEEEDEDEDNDDSLSSANGSASEDDSDEHMSHLPTGAFG